MDLRPYVEAIQSQLVLAGAAGGEQATAVAERLTAAADPAVRLALQDALVAAAEEITCELAPGSVELRLRGRDPEFVVRHPPVYGRPLAEGPGDHGEDNSLAGADLPAPPAPADADEGGTARVNLRLPEQLKLRAEQAAANDRMSLNAWLVKAVAAALERPVPAARDTATHVVKGRRYVGWAR